MRKIKHSVWIGWLMEYAEVIGAGFRTFVKDGKFIHVVHINGEAIVSVYEA